MNRSPRTTVSIVGRWLQGCLTGLREQEVPLIYVSHSADELHLLTRKILKLEAGQIVAQGPTSDMLKLISAHASLPATVLEVNETSGRVMLRLEHYRGISGISGLSPGDRICVSINSNRI